MTSADQLRFIRAAHPPGKAAALALRLADAENALHTLTAGQLDAIVDPRGKTYLMRPAQEYLRQSERRLQDLLESVADVITVVSRGGMILSQNRAVNRMLGYDQKELVGSVLFKLIHNADVSAVYSAFINVIEGYDEHATTRFRHLTRDGSYCFVEATLGRWRDASVESVVFSLRPISGPAVLAEAGQTEANGIPPTPNVVRFFTKPASESGVTHLPSLPGVEKFKEQGREDESLPVLTMVPDAPAPPSRLVARLDEFTSAGPYRVRLQCASIDAHGSVQLILELHQSETAGMLIEVLIEIEISDRLAFEEPLKLQQAMWSLVKDSVETASRDSGGFDASMVDAAGTLAPAFAADGPYVEPELLPLVFSSLQEGDDALLHLYGGLRFGLLIAKGVAAAQGGSLTVANAPSSRNAPFRLNFKVSSVVTR